MAMGLLAPHTIRQSRVGGGPFVYVEEAFGPEVGVRRHVELPDIGRYGAARSLRRRGEQPQPHCAGARGADHRSDRLGLARG